MEKIKYPKTYHFPFSEAIKNDDKVLYDYSSLENQDIVILMKMDGENTTLTKNYFHARSVNSDPNHESRKKLQELFYKISYQIPENYRICGENLYAKHSIYYDNLNSYFQVFNIWNEKNECLSYDDTMELCFLFDLDHVENLYEGKFDIDFIKDFASNFDTVKNEGFVVRNRNSFHYNDFSKNVVKFVRKNHVQTDKHWMYSKLEFNKLKKIMKYKIKIEFTTGDSFGTERTEGFINMEWDNIDVAKENLQRIREHYSMHDEISNQRWNVNMRTQDLLEKYKTKEWFVHDLSKGKINLYTALHSLKIKADNGNEMITSAFWFGYFEQLHSAEIVVDSSDMKIEF